MKKKGNDKGREKMPTMDIESWDYDDGSVGARLVSQPEGDMWARDMGTLVKATIWLTQKMEQSVKKTIQEGTNGGMLDLGMQLIQDEGEFMLKFQELPGFGVTFPRAECVNLWINEWLTPWLKVHGRSTRGVSTFDKGQMN